MILLTPYEQRMLDGEFGAAKQVALQKIIDYAQILGAEELVPTTSSANPRAAAPISAAASWFSAMIRAFILAFLPYSAALRAAANFSTAPSSVASYTSMARSA